MDTIIDLTTEQQYIPTINIEDWLRDMETARHFHLWTEVQRMKYDEMEAKEEEPIL